MINTNIKNVRFVEMVYDHIITFNIQEIANDNDFETDDIEAIECGKWGHLNIILKDGSIVTTDVCRYNGADIKWVREKRLYDANYKELI